MTLLLSPDKFNEFKTCLKKSGYEFEERPHQEFLARKSVLVVNLYTNGKITFGGKDQAERAWLESFIASLNGCARGAAHLSYHNGKIVLKTPYDEQFVSELKAGLASRRFDAARKAWIVDASEREKLLNIADRYFQIVEESPPGSPAAEPSVPDFDPAALLAPGVSVEIWTDGACVKNPGPGGYGIVFRCRGCRWEKAGGFSLTTNNRMELMAAIVALETLPGGCRVVLYSDSRYLVDSVRKGWAKGWQAHGWIKSDKKTAENADLWERLLGLLAEHQIEFKWVLGHAANVENSRCDELAESYARKKNLPADTGYTAKPLKSRLL